MLWVTIDVDILDHPKVAELPTDAARIGWFKTIFAAKKQRQQGQFASERHYRVVVGRYGRYLPVYVKARLLDRLDDGSLVVHGWPEYQRDAAGRKALERSQDSHDPVTEMSQQSPRARALSLSTVSVSNDQEQRNDGSVPGSDPLDVAMRWLAQRNAAVQPASRTETELARLVDQHGAKRVIAAMSRLPQPLHDGRQYVFGAMKVLNPIPDAKDAAVAERAAQEQASLDRRVEATKRRIAAYTGAES